jgi:hypothetical protein
MTEKRGDKKRDSQHFTLNVSFKVTKSDKDLRKIPVQGSLSIPSAFMLTSHLTNPPHLTLPTPKNVSSFARQSEMFVQSFFLHFSLLDREEGLIPSSCLTAPIQQQSGFTSNSSCT